MNRKIMMLQIYIYLLNIIEDVQEINYILTGKRTAFDGGKGSGNFGHAGRPGEVGGSAPEEGSSNSSGSSEKSGESSNTSNTTSSAGKREYKPPKFNQTKDENHFKESLLRARESNAPEDRWRVDDGGNTNYNNAKMYVTDEGSTCTIRPDGDIVSVCKMQGSTDRGSDIVQFAINNGGDRLDAFGERLFDFYTKNGFEPVSWTAFDERFKPNGWLKGRDNAEPILFYRYVGKEKSKGLNFEKFFIDNPIPMEYDKAAKYRDKIMEGDK